jgi:glucose/arabinose dehydrogenase
MGDSAQLLPDYIEDFGFPVCLAFSKSGSVFISDRITGRLWRIDQKGRKVIKTFPVVPLLGHNETGLLGVVLDPDFEENRFVHCYYTFGADESKYFNRVVKIRDDGTGEQIILDNIPAGLIHNGGIMAFGPDKTLYIGVGVQDEIMDKAQDVKWLGGKILRINRDGSIPEDNPYAKSPVYSYGHRNIFGLAFHPVAHTLYACDVGPDKNDEINVIIKGKNYGWPVVTGISDNPAFTNPIKTYEKVITPTQCVVVNDCLYLGSFNEGSVHQLKLGGKSFDKVLTDEIVHKDTPWGIVGVFYSPDHHFYITLPNSIKKIPLA